MKDDLIAFKQRETYISTINHDLKIPTLAQIRALELLLSGNLGSLNNEQKEIILLTLESCKSMYGIILTILASYKYENKNIPLDLKLIKLTDILDNCFKNLSEELVKKNVKFIFKNETNEFNIPADEIQIKKAFENLINFCFSSAYENTNFVCSIKKRHEKELSISFLFENPFLLKEKYENLFNMYTTPAEKLDKVGSGLRLYLAKQIINAHKGSITVKNRNSKNICNIILPCY